MPPKGSGSTKRSGRRLSDRAIAIEIEEAVATATAGAGTAPPIAGAGAATPSQTVTWFSDDMFETSPRSNRSRVSTYRIVTLAIKHAPEMIVKVQTLISIYAGRYESLKRNAPALTTPAALAKNQKMMVDAKNLLSHLQVLYGWRNEPSRFLGKVKSIVEPFEERTFLFQLKAGDWVEVPRGEAGDFVEGLLRSKGL